jgi:hypothetical protein
MNYFIKKPAFYEFLLGSLGDLWTNQAVATDPQEHVLRIARLCPSLIEAR